MSLKVDLPLIINFIKSFTLNIWRIGSEEVNKDKGRWMSDKSFLELLSQVS